MLLLPPPSPTAEPGVLPGTIRPGPAHNQSESLARRPHLGRHGQGEELWEVSTYSRLCFRCRKAPVILLLGLSAPEQSPEHRSCGPRGANCVCLEPGRGGSCQAAPGHAGHPVQPGGRCPGE